MGKLIPQVIVAGLGAAVSPVAVTLLLAVMMRKHAKRNSLLYLLGFTLVLVTYGVLAVFVLHKSGSGGKGHTDDYINLAVGVLCLVFMVITIMKKPKERKAEQKDLKPRDAFILGVVAMVTNLSTIVIYLAGAHMITQASVGNADSAVALATMTFVTLLTLLIPIAIYFIFPNSADRVLGRLSAWLGRHSKIIGVAILAIFGVYLVVKGIIGLV